jgi:hypothetical protein
MIRVEKNGLFGAQKKVRADRTDQPPIEERSIMRIIAA